MIFILNLGLAGVEFAIVIYFVFSLLVLLTYFFRKNSTIAFVNITLNKTAIKQINLIGFPSFLSEIGMGVFTISYNIAIAYYAGTVGLAAFSVLNYLHTFRSEEHTSELQSRGHLVCRLLLEKKKQ